MRTQIMIWLSPLALAACIDATDAGGGEPTQADYSPAELQALAQSEEVQRDLEPFANAPPADRMLYVSMADGVRLALSLYFPRGFEPTSGRAPTVYSETWYTRRREAQAMPIDLYREAGFVVAIADVRGFGASFGSQSGYLTEAQRSDQREMLAWLAVQPWSNGDVAVTGTSVSAMEAEAALASGAPSLKVGSVRATEFDQYAENLFPGGVPNPRMRALIGGLLEDLNGAPCFADPEACTMYGPVDGDDDYALLRQALYEHHANVTGAALDGVLYSDDFAGSVDFDAVSPRGHARELAEHALPTRVSASWLDGATAQGALARYAALRNVPMQLSLTATTHLAGLDADPFAHAAFAPARIPPERALAADVAFLTRALAGEPVTRRIDYYVLGADTWKSTSVWPPSDVRDELLQLSEHGLEPRAPQAGERSYQVDPSTSSGPFNRWASQQNQPIYYGDRRTAPGVRAQFDAAASSRDLELVGAPELCLVLRSDQTDGVVFAYLEDVAPDGRVTYLTEAELRLLHRKTRSGGCDPARGTERSFARADAAPVAPAERMHVELPFLPVAARIAKGHHLRLSLAGADQGTFPSVSDAPARWSIHYGGHDGSSLSVPLRPWK